MIVRELITKLGYQVETSKFAEVDRQVGQLKNKLGGMTTNLNALADGMGRVGMRMTMMFTLPLLALGGFSVKAASDAEEMRNKFNTVFRDIRTEADATAKVLSESYGLGDTEARRLLGTTGDLLKGFGFTQKQALSLSRQVNILAADLTSFNDLQGGVKRASDALTKGLLGERESMKLIGAVVSENDPEFKRLVKHYQTTEKATLLQAKALTTLQMAYDQNKDALGDYARTQFQLANQMRFFSIRFRDVREAIGRMLVETLKLDKLLVKINSGFLKLKNFLAALTPFQQKVIVFTTLFVMAIPPLLIVLSSLMKMIFFLQSGLLVLKAAFFTGAAGAATFNLSLILIPVLILAAIVALILFIDELNVWRKGGETAFGGFFDSVAKFVVGWNALFTKMGETMANWVHGNKEGLAENLKHWKGFFDYVYARQAEKFSRAILGDWLFERIKELGGYVADVTDPVRVAAEAAARIKAGGIKPGFEKGIVFMPGVKPVPAAQVAAAGGGGGGINMVNHLNLSFGEFAGSTLAPDQVADMVSVKVSDAIVKKVKETITDNPPEER